VTTRSTTPRVFTSDRLFTTAWIVGAFLVPHVVIGSLGDWPMQPFTLHAFIVLLLTLWGFDVRRRIEPAVDQEVALLRRMIEQEG
jgi:hypothetical protein